MRTVPAMLCVLAAVTACRPRSPRAAAIVNQPSADASDRSTAPPPRPTVVVRAVACGFGGVGPALPPPSEHPLWVMLTLEARSDQNVVITFERLSLIDPAERVVGESTPPNRLTFDPQTDTLDDTDRWPTSLPLAASVSSRIRTHTRLSGPHPNAHRAVRFRALLRTEHGDHFEVHGVGCSQWATA